METASGDMGTASGDMGMASRAVWWLLVSGCSAFDFGFPDALTPAPSL